MKLTPKSNSKKAETSKRAKEDQASMAGHLLKIAQLHSEKCELASAEEAFQEALEVSKVSKDPRGQMEALAGLLRISSEALDATAMARWDAELDALIERDSQNVPPLAWHCKGAVARYRNNPGLAQRYWGRYLRAVKRDVPENEQQEALLKGLVSLAIMWRANKPMRAYWLAETILRRFEEFNFKGVNGFLYMMMGSRATEEGRLEEAFRWYQTAHASFLSEHNWYYHLFALLGYARVCRGQQNFPQAYWYLDMLEKAAAGAHFGQLRNEISAEKARLEQSAVDLLIDSRKGVIKTREAHNISFGKQYVLLHILEALSVAHSRIGDDLERGLSKSEIIERVWKEPYRPEAHDNKLYYNINRLRKLIEPDVKNPQYLLNWKEGYRLAPGLRVQFVGTKVGMTGDVKQAIRGGA